MIEIIFWFIALLWFALAIVVHSHAKSNGKNGIFWFLAVLLTGIFGMMIYILVITYNGTDDVSEGEPFSEALLSDIPGYAAYTIFAIILTFIMAIVGVGLLGILIGVPLITILAKKVNENWELVQMS